MPCQGYLGGPSMVNVDSFGMPGQMVNHCLIFLDEPMPQRSGISSFHFGRIGSNCGVNPVTYPMSNDVYVAPLHLLQK